VQSPPLDCWSGLAAIIRQERSMSVKFRKRAIAVGVASAATVAAGLGVATTVDGASAVTKVHHLKFVAVTIGEHNTGHFTFVSTEVNRHHGKIVGYDTSSEKFNFHTPKPFLWVAISRKGGLLLAHATIDESGHFAGKVTGGRGRFSGARGVLRGFSPEGSNKTFVRVRYHF
jgi:hypothetical protein